MNKYKQLNKEEILIDIETINNTGILKLINLRD